MSADHSSEHAPGARCSPARPGIVPAGGLHDLIAPGDAVVGIDVGGTKTHAVLFASSGPVASSRRATITSGAPGVLATIKLAMTGLTSHAAEHCLRVSGIGLGIPGMVSTREGTVSHGVNIGLRGADVPLAKLVQKELGIHTRLINDVTAATLGAARMLGVGEDVALISIGTGLAMGTILDGVPRFGTLGGAGEIGHIPYLPDGVACPCGQRGCLELYASGSALQRMWSSSRGATAENLIAAASRGDADACHVLETWMAAVCHAVITVGLTLDVGVILISGGVSEAGQPFLDELRDQLHRRARTSAFLARMDLPSRLALVPPGLDVAPLGAALAALT